MALPFPRSSGTDILASNYSTALTGLKARIEAEQTRRNSGLGLTYTYTGNPDTSTHTTYNWTIPLGTTSITIEYCISGAGGGGGHGNYLGGGFPCCTAGTAGTGAAFVSKTIPGGYWSPGDTLEIKVGRRGRRGWGHLFNTGTVYMSPDGYYACGPGCGEIGQTSEITNLTTATTIVKATGGGGSEGHARYAFIFCGCPDLPCCPDVGTLLVTGVNGLPGAGPGGKADGTGGSVTVVGAGTNGTNGYGYTGIWDNNSYPRTNISGLAGGYENYGYSGASGSPCGYWADQSGDGLVRLTYVNAFAGSLTDVDATVDVSKALFDEYKAAIVDMNINSISLGALTATNVTIGTDVITTYINALEAGITALENETL